MFSNKDAEVMRNLCKHASHDWRLVSFQAGVQCTTLYKEFGFEVFTGTLNGKFQDGYMVLTKRGTRLYLHKEHAKRLYQFLKRRYEQ